MHLLALSKLQSRSVFQMFLFRFFQPKKQTSRQPDNKPFKSAQEREKGLQALYLSTVPKEGPPLPVKLPETLPPGHPWAACWEKSGLAGTEIIPYPVRVVRG
ncbi:hypothetical protein Agub_g11381 [Astrephomene gubernaculifera]|uniref:Uncharacterized protein n=1 Tax=Astrephomene gubernaculifera TaxID=47775 RepID=A0AAD3HQX6_9CHLO|nr:hypothetical protein Agub_g11381 [Astrephomene gubernaculifera]